MCTIFENNKARSFRIRHITGFLTIFPKFQRFLRDCSDSTSSQNDNPNIIAMLGSRQNVTNLLFSAG